MAIFGLVDRTVDRGFGAEVGSEAYNTWKAYYQAGGALMLSQAEQDKLDADNGGNRFTGGAARLARDLAFLQNKFGVTNIGITDKFSGEFVNQAVDGSAGLRLLNVASTFVMRRNNPETGPGDDPMNPNPQPRPRPQQPRPATRPTTSGTGGTGTTQQNNPGFTWSQGLQMYVRPNYNTYNVEYAVADSSKTSGFRVTRTQSIFTNEQQTLMSAWRSSNNYGEFISNSRAIAGWSQRQTGLAGQLAAHWMTNVYSPAFQQKSISFQQPVNVQFTPGGGRTYNRYANTGYNPIPSPSPVPSPIPSPLPVTSPTPEIAVQDPTPTYQMYYGGEGMSEPTPVPLPYQERTYYGGAGILENTPIPAPALDPNTGLPIGTQLGSFDTISDPISPTPVALPLTVINQQPVPTSPIMGSGMSQVETENRMVEQAVFDPTPIPSPIPTPSKLPMSEYLEYAKPNTISPIPAPSKPPKEPGKVQGPDPITTVTCTWFRPAPTPPIVPVVTCYLPPDTENVDPVPVPSPVPSPTQILYREPENDGADPITSVTCYVPAPTPPIVPVVTCVFPDQTEEGLDPVPIIMDDINPEPVPSPVPPTQILVREPTDVEPEYTDPAPTYAMYYGGDGMSEPTPVPSPVPSPAPIPSPIPTPIVDGQPYYGGDGGYTFVDTNGGKSNTLNSLSTQVFLTKVIDTKIYTTWKSNFAKNFKTNALNSFTYNGKKIADLPKIKFGSNNDQLEWSKKTAAGRALVKLDDEFSRRGGPRGTELKKIMNSVGAADQSTLRRVIMKSVSSKQMQDMRNRFLGQ